MQIREATIKDAPAISRLLQTIADIGSVQSRAIENTIEIVRSNLERAQESGTSSVFVSLNDEQRVVAYCAVHWVPFLFMKGGEAYVTELFVDQAFAGGGLGAALMNHVIDESRRRGCSRLSLLNDRDAQSYQRAFYAKQGFTERPAMANFVLKL
jgi:N-acetylglutamate synthase-like GNAT family acetyltransferase